MNLFEILHAVHYIAIYRYLFIIDLVALSKTSRHLYIDFKTKPAEFWMALCQQTASLSLYSFPKRSTSPYHMKDVKISSLQQYGEATASLYVRHMTPYGTGGFWDKALHPCTTFGEFVRFLLERRSSYKWGCSLLLYPDYHRLLQSTCVMWRFFLRRFTKSLQRLQKHMRIVVVRGRRHRLVNFSQSVASLVRPGDFILLQAEDDPFSDHHPWSRFQVAFLVIGRGFFQHQFGRRIWKDISSFQNLALRDFAFNVGDDPIAARYPAVCSFLQSGRTMSAFLQDFGLTYFRLGCDQGQDLLYIRHSFECDSMTPLLDAWERHIRHIYGLEAYRESSSRLFATFLKRAYSIGLSVDLFWADGRYYARLGVLPQNRRELWPVPVRAFATMTALFAELDHLEFPDRSPYDFMEIYDSITMLYF